VSRKPADPARASAGAERELSERELSGNARRVLAARYLERDAAGRPSEDFEGLCWRVARGVAAAEAAYGGDVGRTAEAFFRALRRREFLPNSPTLMNAGTPLGQLSACFVLPIEDSLEGIFEAAKRMAVIHQSGGGTGFSFSSLRPAGDVVQRTHGIASGPVSFLGVFDAATSVVKQGGRRRGANMGVLRADHPDVLEFVRVKRQPGRITNFNLSVAVPDAFMRAALAAARYDLVNPRDGKAVKSVSARELLDEIAHNAWHGGDPGVIFLDAINRANPTPALGELEATNPCGELPLLPNESCNLGSIRLDAFVVPAAEPGAPGRIDFERLDATVDLAVRFLDDVIDASRYPYPEIAAVTRANRKIGLGVMGFADLLVELGVPYDSPEAARTAEALMARIRARAEAASERLAAERGVFPHWPGSRLSARGLRRRNATVLSIAPTGTLSILAGCAGGIEPFFALAFVRHVLDGETLAETNERFESALRRAGAWSADLVEEVRAKGSVRGIRTVPEAIRRLFPIASDIPAEAHLRIQEAFQRHVDNAVSKTINLPAETSPEEIAGIYATAWRRGLKGITVFREGCKGMAVLVRGRGGVEVDAEFAGGCSEAHCS
jgi:ribonucleoside-diphosphate reductase alpha chain